MKVKGLAPSVEQVMEITKDIELSIGEGVHGIVFPFSDLVCFKYYKFADQPNEYAMLKSAHRIGMPVPKPVKRIPELRSIAMEFIHGQDIAKLIAAQEKFCRKLVKQIVETVEEFNAHFIHGDLYPRNVMLSEIEKFNGIIVEADVFIIDLVTAQKGKSKEFLKVRPWFHGLMA